LGTYAAGILCKHALRVLNINEVFVLPSQYILNRWTKYAKTGVHCEKKQIDDNETSRAQAARISRKATSIALKCSVSKDLLDDLERAIEKLDQEADNSLSQRPTQPSGVSQSCFEYAGDMLNGKISIRAPEVLTGAKNKRAKSVLEKKKGKKKPTSKKKGTYIS
jgi:hypothetical protein